MRGEHERGYTTRGHQEESPPLARRAPTRRMVGVILYGITSACAESTAAQNRVDIINRNHLRLRGEHRLPVDRLVCGTESPPLARRALDEPHASPVRPGITSACAESTGPAEWITQVKWNHLRLRGEHIEESSAPNCLRESPPLARRALDDAELPRRRIGITSACAESTRGSRGSGDAPRNHLRLRGEHSSSSFWLTLRVESPPLARRALCEDHGDGSDGGITSACAESTCGWSACLATWGNHLRLRGEHDIVATMPAISAESPPLARRAPQRVVHVPLTQGITSACAESTQPTLTNREQNGNHLRLRGEHRVAEGWPVIAEESPPLARRALGAGAWAG